MGCCAALLSGMLRKNPLRLIPFHRMRHGRLLPLGIAAALGVSFLSAAIVSLLAAGLSAAHVGLSSGVIAFPKQSGATVLYVLLFGVAAPSVEECIFRGLIFQSFRRYGERFAILASAILFALAHGDLAQLPLTFSLGLLLAAAVALFDSIWPAIAMHAAVNGLSVLVLYLRQTVGYSAGQVVFILVGAISLAIAVVAAAVAWKKGEARKFLDSRPVVAYPAGRLVKSILAAPGMYAFLFASLFFCVLSIMPR